MAESSQRRPSIALEEVCSSGSVLVQVEAPSPCTSAEKASARKLLQDVFTKPAAAAPPVTQLNQSAAPGQAQQEVVTAQVPYQATWPSAPGLWALGNKSRSAKSPIWVLLSNRNLAVDLHTEQSTCIPECHQCSDLTSARLPVSAFRHQTWHAERLPYVTKQVRIRQRQQCLQRSPPQH